ncbi:MAG: hypothetical protein JWP15_263 [Alphaproteobacteria bacterium]|nr:hypothetical protein [Alphaproteobacteria bacterium]
MIEQVAVRPEGSAVHNLFNIGGEEHGGLASHASRVSAAAGDPLGRV